MKDQIRYRVVGDQLQIASRTELQKKSIALDHHRLVFRTTDTVVAARIVLRRKQRARAGECHTSSR